MKLSLVVWVGMKCGSPILKKLITKNHKGTQTEADVPVSELTMPVSESGVHIVKHVCTQTDLTYIFEPRPRGASLSISSNHAEPSQSVQQGEYLFVDQA